MPRIAPARRNGLCNLARTGPMTGHVRGYGVACDNAQTGAPDCLTVRFTNSWNGEPHEP